MTRTQISLRLTATVLAVISSTSMAFSAIAFRTVTLSGNAAPGTPAGVTFNTFSPPTVNDAGDTAFEAFLAGQGVVPGNDSGVWSESAAVLGLVAREGNAAPGAGVGVNFSSFNYPIINSAGQTGFLANLSNGGQGVFSDAGGPLGAVTVTGNAAPGTGGATFQTLTSPAFNDAGQTGFLGFLAGAGVGAANNEGIWSEGGGPLALVAREGNAAPGAGAGVTFGPLGKPDLNSAGQAKFFAQLTGGGVGVGNDESIYSEGTGALAPVVLEGTQAPGMALGVVFGSVAPATPAIAGSDMNDAGQTAFRSNIAGPGIGAGNDEGIWSEGGGLLALVAQKGSPAPGTLPGVLFSGLTDPVIGNTGANVFGASLAGPGVVPFPGINHNDTGLWSDASGVLSLVARAGDPAPGMAPNILFSTLQDPVINDLDHVAFRGSFQLLGGGVTNTDGIFVDGPNGLEKIVANGDVLQVAAGDFRTVNQIGWFGFSGNEDGRGTGFSDGGAIGFSATFLDGSEGVFAARIRGPDGIIPEPSTFLIWALGLVGLAWCARRRRTK